MSVVQNVVSTWRYCALNLCLKVLVFPVIHILLWTMWSTLDSVCTGASFCLKGEG